MTRKSILGHYTVEKKQIFVHFPTTVLKRIDLRLVKYLPTGRQYCEALQQKIFRHMVYKSLSAVYTSFVYEIDLFNFLC